MDLLPCPHCDLMVSVGEDGICPSCHRSLDQPPQEIKRISGGLTVAEQVYTAFVIMCGLLVMMSMIIFHLLIIPTSDNPTVFYFMTTIGWIVVSTLAVTVGCNIWKHSLLVIPTVIQVILLCILIYFSPIGIWGGCLLYFSLKRDAKQV